LGYAWEEFAGFFGLGCWFFWGLLFFWLILFGICIYGFEVEDVFLLGLLYLEDIIFNLDSLGYNDAGVFWLLKI
jgi:hypothetical protein